jgi:hypothetical protein
MEVEFKEEMVEYFFEIDENNSGMISRKELRNHLTRVGKNDREINAIAKTFDLDRSGHITFEEYCVVMELDHKQTQRREKVIPETVQVISTDMDIHRQYNIANITIDVLERAKEMKDAPKALKAALDKRYNKLFHVVVVKGQYWAYYSHEPRWSFVFRVGGYIVLIWRTPFL